MDVHLAARVRRLVASGCSIRSAARELGVSRSAAMRVMSAAPVIDLADEFDGEGDPWEDDDGLPVALADDDAREPAEYLTPPFDAVGLVDVRDNFPVRRRDGQVRQAPEWADATGRTFGVVDLWRWGLRLYEITPDGYPTKDAYLAAWDARDQETEAVKRHAWESLAALGIVYDDTRGRWVQRPQAV